LVLLPTITSAAIPEEGEYFHDFVGPLGRPSELVEQPLEEVKSKKILFVAGGVGAAPVANSNTQIVFFAFCYQIFYRLGYHTTSSVGTVIRGKSKKILFVAGGVGAAPVYPQVKWLHEHGIAADVIVGILKGLQNHGNIPLLLTVPSFWFPRLPSGTQL